jgi:hypothetical protein
MSERAASPEPDPGDAAAAVLSELQARPDDESLREQAAVALLGAGRGQEALALLHDALVHLNAHDEGALPCLCKRCLDPGMDRAVVSGKEFTRDLAVARGRVLFYWLPASLAGARVELRRNVAARMPKQPPRRRTSTP